MKDGYARAELASANTGRCNALGVCNGVGVATGGSNYARVISGLTGGDGWINRAAFTSAPCIGGTIPGNCLGSGGGTGWGNSGIGILSSPGQDNWDISIIKHTKITEALNTEFRTEFYNAWNHAQFNPPANNFGSITTLGVITSSSVPPRVLQFALKLLF
jgi:hypothetical protein